MKIIAKLPFEVNLVSRATYTLQEAKDVLKILPTGFTIVTEEEAHRLTNPIEFPLLEEMDG